jgi:hypothetical protein
MYFVRQAHRQALDDFFRRRIDDYDAVLDMGEEMKYLLDDENDTGVDAWLEDTFVRELQHWRGRVSKMRRGDRIVRSARMSRSEFRALFPALVADDANPFVGLSAEEWTALRDGDDETDVWLSRSRKGHHRNGRSFYVRLPVRVDVTLENAGRDDNGRVAAMDPGGRKMMTWIDPVSGKQIEWGHQSDMEALEVLDARIGDIQSRMVAKDRFGNLLMSHTRRSKSRRVKLRLFQRKRNMIDDLHRKLCKYLFENYAVILLPEFAGARSMYPRQTRVIGKEPVKTLLTWSHYKFRQLMLNKAKRYPHVQLVIVNEA